jgi:hypothetical protein
MADAEIAESIKDFRNVVSREKGLDSVSRAKTETAAEYIKALEAELERRREDFKPKSAARGEG